MTSGSTQPNDRLARFERLKFHQIIKLIEHWGILFAFVGFGATLYSFTSEIKERKYSELNRAWSLIAQVPGYARITNYATIGLGPALETVAKHKENMYRIRMLEANLQETDLKAAHLREADFKERRFFPL